MNREEWKELTRIKLTELLLNTLSKSEIVPFLLVDVPAPVIVVLPVPVIAPLM